jgi:hypothetical protein
MSESGAATDDPLRGWDPRRRAALERIWADFDQAAGDANLSDELIAERRQEAAAEDRALDL